MGAADPTFSGDGIRKVDVSPKDYGHAVLVQPNGKIVLAGAASCWPGCQHEFVVVRLLPGGQRDPRFGSGGVVQVGFPDALNEVAMAVARDSLGRIVVAGTTEDHELQVLRLLRNGSMDPDFGEAGRALIGVPDVPTRAHAVTVDEHDRIVTAGYNFAAARLRRNGNLDTSFGEGGFVGLRDRMAIDVEVMRDGRIVSILEEYGPAAMRMSADGVPDESFGERGVASFPKECRCAWWGGTVHRGRIVVVGQTDRVVDGTADYGTVVGRLTFDGHPDQKFGDQGVASRFGFDRAVIPTDVDIGPPSKIVSGGKHDWNRLILLRYLWE